jgi:hypothetical protein
MACSVNNCAVVLTGICLVTGATALFALATGQKHMANEAKGVEEESGQ